MPVKYRHIVKLEWHRRFTWRERIGILLGSSLLVQLGLVTQHNPGLFQPMFLGRVSKSLTPDERHREIIENMLSEKHEDPIVHEKHDSRVQPS